MDGLICEWKIKLDDSCIIVLFGGLRDSVREFV